MKVSVDNNEIFTVSEHNKTVLKDSIFRDKLDDTLKSALFSIINCKYNACFARLKKEWEPKLLARGITTIPTDKDAFAQLVFEQPDYKDRSAKDLEASEL